MDSFDGLEQLERLQQAARATRHRRLAVLAGRVQWARQTAAALAHRIEPGALLWVGDPGQAPVAAVDHHRASAHLGRDLDLLVYDAASGFDPDAFGAATGAVRGGGMILLLTPPLRAWPDLPDPCAERITIAGYRTQDLANRLIRRLAGLLERAPEPWVWHQGAPAPVAEIPAAIPRPPGPPDAACLTRGQADAVSAVGDIARARGDAALVLSAHRGRGKSAALGIAAGRLLAGGEAGRIVVTAPRSAAAEAVFRHAGLTCPAAVPGKLSLRRGDALLEYTAPDALIQAPVPARLLLVDEAAGIPAPLLEGLLRHYHRVVFATTVHGYEGTGRGFAIRFTDALDRLRPGWRRLALDTPVRWAPNDPVERFVDEALLLDAEAAADSTMTGVDRQRVSYQRLDRDALLADEPRLRQLFGLLVNAHYRTTPTDLRNLLDGPTIGVHVLVLGGSVAAAALTVDEGGFDEALSAAVWLGRRRPHGHLLPQSLTFHAGQPRAAGTTCRRVMRIAVHPAARRRGLGLRLFQEVAAGARDDGLDTAGASFGATADLLDFWSRAGCRLVRIGHRREASSGVHAAMVLRGLSDRGQRLCREAAAGLRADLAALLAGPLADLEAPVRRLLPDPAEPGTPATNEHDCLLAHGFARAQRPLSSTLGALRRLLAGVDPGGLSQENAELLRLCVGELVSPAVAAARLGIASRGETLRRLRRAVAAALDRVDDPRVRAAGERCRTLEALADALTGREGYAIDECGRVTAVSVPS